MADISATQIIIIIILKKKYVDQAILMMMCLGIFVALWQPIVDAVILLHNAKVLIIFVEIFQCNAFVVEMKRHVVEAHGIPPVDVSHADWH